MKPSFLTLFWLLLKKEFLIGVRTRESLVSALFFTFLVVLIFHFGFSLDEGGNVVPYLTPFIWLAALFGGMLRLNQTFEPENEGKVMDGMRQIPGIAAPFYLSKFIFNLFFIILLMIFTSVMLVLLFNVREPLAYFSLAALPLFLGAMGLACIGTVFSNMVISHNRREIILSVISYPILIPLIMGVLKSVVYTAGGQILGIDAGWIKILAVFDLVFLILALGVFDFIIDA